MRRRSQYELDSLFAEYGFKKDNMLIDNWGIFTVSSAQFNQKTLHSDTISEQHKLKIEEAAEEISNEEQKQTDV